MQSSEITITVRAFVIPGPSTSSGHRLNWYPIDTLVQLDSALRQAQEPLVQSDDI